MSIEGESVLWGLKPANIHLITPGGDRIPVSSDGSRRPANAQDFLQLEHPDINLHAWNRGFQPKVWGGKEFPYKVDQGVGGNSVIIGIQYAPGFKVENHRPFLERVAGEIGLSKHLESMGSSLELMPLSPLTKIDHNRPFWELAGEYGAELENPHSRVKNKDPYREDLQRIADAIQSVTGQKKRILGFVEMLDF
ncbi:MAG: hypothetical protein ABH950_09855 [Candidatus Altiarchaeota archaeon]